MVAMRGYMPMCRLQHNRFGCLQGTSDGGALDALPGPSARPSRRQVCGEGWSG